MKVKVIATIYDNLEKEINEWLWKNKNADVQDITQVHTTDGQILTTILYE